MTFGYELLFQVKENKSDSESELLEDIRAQDCSSNSRFTNIIAEI